MQKIATDNYMVWGYLCSKIQDRVELEVKKKKSRIILFMLQSYPSPRRKTKFFREMKQKLIFLYVSRFIMQLIS